MCSTMQLWQVPALVEMSSHCPLHSFSSASTARSEHVAPCNSRYGVEEQVPKRQAAAAWLLYSHRPWQKGLQGSRLLHAEHGRRLKGSGRQDLWPLLVTVGCSELVLLGWQL